MCDMRWPFGLSVSVCYGAMFALFFVFFFFVRRGSAPCALYLLEKPFYLEGVRPCVPETASQVLMSHVKPRDTAVACDACVELELREGSVPWSSEVYIRNTSCYCLYTFTIDI